MRSWTAVLDALFFSIPLFPRLLIILFVMLLMVAISRGCHFLTWGGALTALILGFTVMYIGGISGIVLLLFFFFSSSVISKLVKRTYLVEKKSSERDMMQVLANGLPAAFSLVLFRLTPYPAAFLAAFAAALAEAEADTLSGEIGRLSHRDPVSIVSLTRVPKGLSGGITVLGLVAGALSSLLVAMLFMGTFGCDFSSFMAVTSAGFLGSVFDSLLGATLQVQYRRKDGSLTERGEENGERNERARGVRWIDNDMVNLLSGLFAAAISSSLVMLI